MTILPFSYFFFPNLGRQTNSVELSSNPPITNPMKKILLALAMVAELILGSQAHASLVQSNTQITGNQYAIAPTTNLLTQGQSTLGSLNSPNFSPWGASDLSKLNDNDVHGYALDLNDSSWTLYAAFDVSINTLGYNITEIDTISGWAWDYVDQKYNLSYSTVTAPGSYISLGTFTLNDTSGRTAKSLEIALTDSSGIIATNVAKLRFDFQKAGGLYNNPTAYTEIQAFGTPTTQAVPEPSTYALFGLGALALIIAYRRKVA